MSGFTAGRNAVEWPFHPSIVHSTVAIREALSAPAHRLVFDDTANDGYATPQYRKHGWMPANPSRPDYGVLGALAATVDTRTPAEREYDEARELQAWYDCDCDGDTCRHIYAILRAADALRAERKQCCDSSR